MEILNNMLAFYGKFFPWVMAVLGLCIGSFLNVCVHRYVSKQSVVFPASHCPTCGDTLHWWENIPVLSYLFLRGRCGHCGKPISIQYPAVELLTSIWFFLVADKLGVSLQTVFFVVIGVLFIFGSFVDFREYILPDRVTIGGTAIAIAGMIFIFKQPWEQVLLGSAIGAGAFLTLLVFYKYIRKRDGMGFGDVKLMAAIGAITGPAGLPLQVIISGILAMVCSVAWLRKGTGEDPVRIPFGPFLSFGGLIVGLYKIEILTAWYSFLA